MTVLCLLYVCPMSTLCPFYSTRRFRGVKVYHFLALCVESRFIPIFTAYFSFLFKSPFLFLGHSPIGLYLPWRKNRLLDIKSDQITLLSLFLPHISHFDYFDRGKSSAKSQFFCILGGASLNKNTKKIPCKVIFVVFTAYFSFWLSQ